MLNVKDYFMKKSINQTDPVKRKNYGDIVIKKASTHIVDTPAYSLYTENYTTNFWACCLHLWQSNSLIPLLKISNSKIRINQIEAIFVVTHRNNLSNSGVSTNSRLSMDVSK